MKNFLTLICIGAFTVGCSGSHDENKQDPSSQEQNNEYGSGWSSNADKTLQDSSAANTTSPIESCCDLKKELSTDSKETADVKIEASSTWSTSWSEATSIQ